jgi:hypothetical protein
MGRHHLVQMRVDARQPGRGLQVQHRVRMPEHGLERVAALQGTTLRWNDAVV